MLAENWGALPEADRAIVNCMVDPLSGDNDEFRETLAAWRPCVDAAAAMLGRNDSAIRRDVYGILFRIAGAALHKHLNLLWAQSGERAPTSAMNLSKQIARAADSASDLSDALRWIGQMSYDATFGADPARERAVKQALRRIAAAIDDTMAAEGEPHARIFEASKLARELADRLKALGDVSFSGVSRRRGPPVQPEIIVGVRDFAHLWSRETGLPATSPKNSTLDYRSPFAQFIQNVWPGEPPTVDQIKRALAG